jgi:hypothetical protein
MRGTSEEDEDDEYVSEESEGDEDVPEEPDEEEEEEPYEEEIVPQVVVSDPPPSRHLFLYASWSTGLLLLVSCTPDCWACFKCVIGEHTVSIWELAQGCRVFAGYRLP